MKQLIIDERIGKMAAELAQVEGLRVWHDQEFIKKHWTNPTAWHLDTPYWSFDHREVFSILIALNDTILESGSFFIAGSDMETRFDDPDITKNMNTIFQQYPQFVKIRSLDDPMKADSFSFSNGLSIHSANEKNDSRFLASYDLCFFAQWINI